jgi:hypothetical protein
MKIECARKQCWKKKYCAGQSETCHLQDSGLDMELPIITRLIRKGNWTGSVACRERRKSANHQAATERRGEKSCMRIKVGLPERQPEGFYRRPQPEDGYKRRVAVGIRTERSCAYRHIPCLPAAISGKWRKSYPTAGRAAFRLT